MAAIDSVTELGNLLDAWEQENGSAADQLPVLNRIAELMERETEHYLKMDPDPFDDRHPGKGRADPVCTFGHLLKALFKNDNFMNKLVNNYLLNRDNKELSSAACRLLLDIMPGLETSVVFPETEGLVDQLFQWAENAAEPLRSYATGLLAAAMNIQDLTGNYKDQNSLLIPIMLQRLHDLRREEMGESDTVTEKVTKDGETKKRPFAHLSDEPVNNEMRCPKKRGKQDAAQSANCKNRLRLSSPPGPNLVVNESSESSWAEMEPFVIGSHQMHPLTTKMQQRLILQYLTSMGEYQEMLGYCFEHDSLNLILHYIRLRENSDVRLAFEALKYLAALLCHKKFAIEFINVGGLQRLLEVYRPSIAATGVSMCLYYLAYNEDAMERVCLLPSPILYDLVKYSLWLLECSHDSGRCHATMFFSLSFQFRAILDYFDAQDGLRKLFNVISTLEIFSVEEPVSDRLTDDDVFAKRQTARQVCVALKRYYEAHLAIKAEQLRRSHCRNMGISPQQNSVPAFKAAKFSPEKIQANVDTLLEMMPVRMNWAPVDELHRLSGITLLLQLIGMSYDWNYSGRSETIRSILDVLTVCSVMPKTQLSFCDYVPLPDNLKAVGIRCVLNILLGAAEGEIVSDPDVQRSALNVIINCVCGPTSRLGGLIGRVVGSSSRKQTIVRSPEDLLTKMWNCMRSNNGIMVLLNVLMVKTPITDADSIRALACKALVGLSRSEIVKQIISKLPLFTSGHLQALMREPLLQDKRQEHIKFCKYALQLIEDVTDKPLATGIDSSIAKINKANVVAQTKIIYNEKELMQLIHQHLCNKGLVETASMLQKEAALPTGPPRIGFSNFSISTRHLSSPSSIHRIPRFGHGSAMSPVSKSLFGAAGRSSPIPPPPPFSSPATTHQSSHQSAHQSVASKSIANGSSSSQGVGTPNPDLAMRLSLSVTHKSPVLGKHTSPKVVKSTVLQKSQMSSGDYQQSPIMKRHRSHGLAGPATALPASVGASGATVTLDSIVTEYLRKQHALCKNPVATCPPFDLFVPHQCPDPKFINTAPVNFTSRIQRRSINPSYGGVGGAKLDRKLLYSRFRPVRTYRDIDDDGCFTCCTFSACQEFLMLGNSSGKLKVYRIETGQEEVTYNCHHSGLMRCEPSKDGKLMLTSSTWRRPLSALWSLGDLFEMEYAFDEDHHVEFSKLSQDRIVGTKDETAHIYDVTTGQLLLTLKEPEMCNNYTKNRATFNPTDELVLSDGVLWDIRASKAIYKFDKFNPHISGVFHPNGLEIIANSEIWDLRSFHLLHTVPALDQCQITFNFKGDVIFGAIGEEAVELEDHHKSPFGSSFRTFDALDYSNIATIDIKKNIYDMCTDKSDCVVAIIENQGIRDDVTTESICRLYEVGRLRAEDDDLEDDDDDDDHDDDDDDDDDLDNSDDGADSIVETINEDADDDDDGEENGDDDDDEEYGFDGENSGSIGSFRDDTTSESDDSDFTLDDDDEEEDGDEDDDLLFSLND